jgi:hypothetical protein
MKNWNLEENPALIIPQSPREALFLQFAQAYYQEMETVGNNAPFGQVLNQVDAFAFEKTRELGRKSLELVLQDQIEKTEKKRRKKVESVKNAKPKNGITDIALKKSPPPKAK